MSANRPIVTTLCGSSRFPDAYAQSLGKTIEWLFQPAATQDPDLAGGEVR